MRRLLAALGAAGLLLLGSLGVAGGAVAATAAPTTTCSNGVDNTPGLGLICEVTIVNTITGSGGRPRSRSVSATAPPATRPPRARPRRPT